MFNYYKVQVTTDIMTDKQKDLVDDICSTLHISTPYTSTHSISQYEARIFISSHIEEYKFMKEFYSELLWDNLFYND